MSFLLSSFLGVPVSGTIGLLSLSLRWVVFAFHSTWELSLSWAPAVVGLLAGGPYRGCFSLIKSESRHHRCQASVCSSVLSRHSKDVE